MTPEERARDAIATGDPHRFVHDGGLNGASCLCRRHAADPIHDEDVAPLDDPPEPDPEAASETKMTKGERDELRRLTRQQFKVLRQEVDQRRAEQAAAVDGQILARFRLIDEGRETLNNEIADKVAAWDKELREFVRARNEETGLIQGMSRLEPPHIKWAPDRRTELRMAALGKIDADVAGAKLRLSRQEVDLQRELAVGALTTEAAHRFLGDIPTVGELVPDARMAELEAALNIDDDGLLLPPDDDGRR